MKIEFNRKSYEVSGVKTVLEAARALDIYIPTLCAYPALHHTPGSCGVCLAEIEYANGRKIITTTCKTGIEEGMKVLTNTPRVRELQKAQLELLFSDHELTCDSCSRHGACELLDLAETFCLTTPKYKSRYWRPKVVDRSDRAIHLDANKCIRCERCVEVCDQIQGIHTLTMDHSGFSRSVGLSEGGLWADSSLCVRCGQCTSVCPTGAVSVSNTTEPVMKWLSDPDIVTVFQFAPAVRATLGEAVGLPPGVNVEKKIVAALKKMGADFVLDTNFTADVVIMEEGTELLGRLSDEKAVLPMFTSCCPGWINFVEQHRPKLIPNVSTTRSPQAVMGALVKTYLPEATGTPREKIRMISIMPCSAKKNESARPALSRDGVPDTDEVITVREFASLVKRFGIDLKIIKDAEFDSPFMSEGSGAAVIFGKSAGVAEAAARTLYFVKTGVNVDEVGFTASMHPHVSKEAKIEFPDGRTLRIGVVHGLANAAVVADEVLAGNSPYDFIEVMACPGGCINGGGTPRVVGDYHPYSHERRLVLEREDRSKEVRQSHNNKEVQKLYEKYLEKPNSKKAHELLHTHYTNRQVIRGSDAEEIWKRMTLA